jgi:EmrB/QacA subfamily drug resistance transporter
LFRTTAPLSASRLRVVPLVVACPMFLQNVDGSVLGTALPAIAQSLHADVLHLNLAITSYLLSLVLFLPASAWLADRFGARRIFCAAVLVFTAASVLCGAATSLGQLVAFRLLQGVGGAMMVPVGRLILLQTVPAEQMVLAMVWFTVPGGIGRLLGPLLGGSIVTVASWRWIFLVNIPFGLVSVLMALRVIDPDPPRAEGVASAPDAVGLVLLALALAGLLGALEMAGKGMLPWPAIVALAASGSGALWLYLRRSAAQDEPLIDFGILRFATYRIAVAGGMPLRVAIGAAPFLLPLLFQLGLGMTPLAAGLLMLASALGSLGSRTLVTAAVARFGYRHLLIVAALVTSAAQALYAFFTPATPQVLLAAVLLVSGACHATVLVILATIGYGEIPRKRMGHATALATMGQQLSVALGVALAASLLEAMHGLHAAGAAPLAIADFRIPLLVMAAIPLLSVLAFIRLTRGDALHAVRPPA